MVTAKSSYSVDGVKGVDRYAVGVLIEEAAPGRCYLEDLLSDHGVQESDPYDGSMT